MLEQALKEVVKEALKEVVKDLGRELTGIEISLVKIGFFKGHSKGYEEAINEVIKKQTI